MESRQHKSRLLQVGESRGRKNEEERGTKRKRKEVAACS